MSQEFAPQEVAQKQREEEREWRRHEDMPQNWLVKIFALDSTLSELAFPSKQGVSDKNAIKREPLEGKSKDNFEIISGLLVGLLISTPTCMVLASFGFLFSVWAIIVAILVFSFCVMLAFMIRERERIKKIYLAYRIKWAQEEIRKSQIKEEEHARQVVAQKQREADLQASKEKERIRLAEMERQQQELREKEHILLAEKERQRAEMERERQEQIAELDRQHRREEEFRIQHITSKIENTILELAPQFTRLEVGDIAERCGVNEEELIIKILNQMIARKQIDAVYFKSSKAVAFQQHVVEKPLAPAVPDISKQLVEVRRQYEYVGGKVRVKVKVINTGKVGLLRVRCFLNLPDSFRLLRVEPADYSAEGAAVKLQDLLPKEEKAVAYVLEPMICGKEQFSGTVSGMEATGDPFATPIMPLEVEVHCPLFVRPEAANLPLLQRMLGDLPVKSERVFYLPDTLSPANAFELAKSAISERDVRFVGSVTAEDRQAGDPFDESAWYYGLTKVGKKRYVLSAAVSEKDRVIRLATACDDEAGCTGFLAEAGAAVRRELVRRGAFESEKDVVELVCEKCGATLPSAPTLDHDVRCPDCQWSWRVNDFFR